MAAKRERLTLELDPDIRESLKRWAAEEGRQPGNLARWLIGQQVGRRDRERAKAEAAAA